jgi:hypothetical protein
LTLLLLSGCTLERTRPLEPAFADANALLRRHPGYHQLQALEEGTAALRRASGAMIPSGQAPGAAAFQPFRIREPEVTPAGSHPAGQRRVEAAVDAELRLVERQLRRDAEPRLAREADRLNAAASQAIAVERDRLGDALAQRLREIELRYRGPESQLVLNLQAAQRRLDESPLAAGEALALELRRRSAESDLQALRTRKAAETDAAEAAMRRALDAFAAAQNKQAAAALNAARRRSDQEIAQALQRQREALVREANISFPPLRASENAGALSFRPIEGKPRQAVRLKTAQDVARLEQLRARVAGILSEETRTAALLVGQRHGLGISFERKAGRPARDVTPQMEQWLDDYWRAGLQGRGEAAPQAGRRAGAAK